MKLLNLKKFNEIDFSDTSANENQILLLGRRRQQLKKFLDQQYSDFQSFETRMIENIIT
jgi:hypothetical protein